MISTLSTSSTTNRPQNTSHSQSYIQIALDRLAYISQIIYHIITSPYHIYKSIIKISDDTSEMKNKLNAVEEKLDKTTSLLKQASEDINYLKEYKKEEIKMLHDIIVSLTHQNTEPLALSSGIKASPPFDQRSSQQFLRETEQLLEATRTITSPGREPNSAGTQSQALSFMNLRFGVSNGVPFSLSPQRSPLKGANTTEPTTPSIMNEGGLFTFGPSPWKSPTSKK